MGLVLAARPSSCSKAAGLLLATGASSSSQAMGSVPAARSSQAAGSALAARAGSSCAEQARQEHWLRSAAGAQHLRPCLPAPLASGAS